MTGNKKLGAFYTPPKLAKWIIKTVLKPETSLSILEPSCGDGIFIREISQTLNYQKHNITAVEIDETTINQAIQKNNMANTQWINQDFLFWNTNKKFDLIIGNPPYISKKHLSKEQAERCKDIHTANLLADKEISNIWTAFVLKAITLLSDTGIIAFVLPAELLQVKYAEEIRKFISDKMHRTEIVLLKNFKFEDTEQNTVVFLGYKQTPLKRGVFFKEISTIDELNKEIPFKESTLGSDFKWTAACLTQAEVDMIHSIKKRCKTNISDMCNAVAGIVTAANSYFIVNKTTAKTYNLEKYTKPIVQKGTIVNGYITLNKKKFDKIINKDIPCYLIDLNNIDEKDFNTNMKKYLEIGIETKINQRYKCLLRNRWFDIPCIWNSEGFFFKRANVYPKIIVNKCNAYVTDSAYRIRMKENYKIENLAFSFYNSFTLLMCELTGRSYGGGVLELTPNEFKCLPVPYCKYNINFSDFQKSFENKQEIEDILEINDKLLLEEILKLTADEVLAIKHIYAKLRKQRLGDKNGN